MIRDTLRAAALTAESVVALRRARIALRERPALIEPLLACSSAHVSAADRAVAGEVATAIRRASRVVSRATCLVRAVAAHGLLARRGVTATLCIGHHAAETAFTAHAWLELEGLAIVGDPSPARFVPPVGR